MASENGNPAENEPVRIATGIRATLQSLGWLGTQIGVFRRLGIEVTFADIEVGGSQAVSGLCDGNWEFCEVGMLPVVQAVLDGHDTVILLAPTRPHVSGYILARREITEPHALANKRIGVLTETAQFAIATRLMLRNWGVMATLVPLGSFKNIYAALEAGSIDAAYLTLDYRIRAERELGANVFPGPALLGNQVLATTRRLIGRSPDLVSRIVRGISNPSIGSKPIVRPWCRCSYNSSNSPILSRWRHLQFFRPHFPRGTAADGRRDSRFA